MGFRWTLDCLVLVFVATVTCSILVAQPLNAQETQTKSIDKNATKASDASKTKTVTLTIDYGDGFQKRFNEIAWTEKMTVIELMQVAKKHKRAGFDFKTQGSGATALLLKIDDVANQGGGKRNWIYHVNKRKGDRSFGIHELKAGDEVLWRFETYL